MKNIVFLSLLFLMSFAVQGQDCYIFGPSTMSVGQTATFIVDAPAQCANCYDWDVSTGLTQVSSTDQLDFISYTATGSGTQQITLTYFNENGCFQCIKTISIPPECACTAKLLGDVVCNCAKGGSHGALWLQMSAECKGKVSSIEWESNGAGLSFLNGETEGVTYGWPPNMGVGTLQDFEYSCINHQYVHVKAIVHFDGCPTLYLESEITHEFCDGSSFGLVELDVFPNPSKSQINIDITTENLLDGLSISIFENVTGHMIKSYKLDSVSSTTITKQIDISSIPNGEYYLILRNHDEKIGEKKILIER